MAKFAVIIPAAGKSLRMGGIKKENIKIGNKTVLELAKENFEDFDEIIVVGEMGSVPGGKTRQESVLHGLLALPDDIDFVLIHDGARPFVSKDLISRVKEKLLEGEDCVIPCVKPKDTVRTQSKTLNRDELFLVQTPQGFRFKEIRELAKRAEKEGFIATDDASIAEHFGKKICIVDGDYENIKITTPEDLPRECKYRFGNGYDLHLLVSGRPLNLGCVNIEFEKGLLGHSDADVIAHAIADAMLGACALGDIGKHFPDNIKETEGLSGFGILQKTSFILLENGFIIDSVDATLVAQRPKIAPYVDQMRSAIARAIGIDKSKVSVKATTEEGIGLTGEGKAMAAYASAVVKEI